VAYNRTLNKTKEKKVLTGKLPRRNFEWGKENGGLPPRFQMDIHLDQRNTKLPLAVGALGMSEEGVPTEPERGNSNNRKGKVTRKKNRA